MDEVVRKAAGVFLWVTLVVKSLLSGVRNRDSMNDLRRRLAALPSDLDAFYSHMLKHVETLYREQAAQSFEIFCHFPKQPNDLEVQALQFDLAIFATPESIISDAAVPMSQEERFLRITRLDAHLKSRCGGLLEVVKFYKIQAETPSKRDLGRVTVGYLHRTVREYLESPEAKVLISASIMNDRFHPGHHIAMSYILMLKWGLTVCNSYGVFLDIQRFGAMPMINLMMESLQPADQDNKSGYIQLVEALSFSGMQQWCKQEGFQGDFLCMLSVHDSGEILDVPRSKENWDKLFLQLVVRYRLLHYLENKLQTQASPSTTKNEEAPLLHWALTSVREARSSNIEVVDLLLKYGADPNELWRGNSPWQCLLTHSHGEDEVVYPQAVFKTMLVHGASLTTTCMENHPVTTSSHSLGFSLEPRLAAHSVDEVIGHVSRSWNNLEAQEIRDLIRHRRFTEGHIPYQNTVSALNIERIPARRPYEDLIHARRKRRRKTLMRRKTTQRRLVSR